MVVSVQWGCSADLGLLFTVGWAMQQGHAAMQPCSHAAMQQGHVHCRAGGRFTAEHSRDCLGDSPLIIVWLQRWQL